MCRYPKFAPKNETILFGGKFADEIFDEPSELSQPNNQSLEEVGKDFEQSYFAQLAENGNRHAIQWFRVQHWIGPSGMFGPWPTRISK